MENFRTIKEISEGHYQGDVTTIGTLLHIEVVNENAISLRLSDDREIIDVVLVSSLTDKHNRYLFEAFRHRHSKDDTVIVSGVSYCSSNPTLYVEKIVSTSGCMKEIMSKDEKDLTSKEKVLYLLYGNVERHDHTEWYTKYIRELTDEDYNALFNTEEQLSLKYLLTDKNDRYFAQAIMLDRRFDRNSKHAYVYNVAEYLNGEKGNVYIILKFIRWMLKNEFEIVKCNCSPYALLLKKLFYYYRINNGFKNYELEVMMDIVKKIMGKEEQPEISTVTYALEEGCHEFIRLIPYYKNYCKVINETPLKKLIPQKP